MVQTTEATHGRRGTEEKDARGRGKETHGPKSKVYTHIATYNGHMQKMFGGIIYQTVRYSVQAVK